MFLFIRICRQSLTVHIWNARIPQQLRNSIHTIFMKKKRMRTKVDVFAFSLHDFNTYGVFVASTAHANQFQMEKRRIRRRKSPWQKQSSWDYKSLKYYRKEWKTIENILATIVVFHGFSLALCRLWIGIIHGYCISNFPFLLHSV